WDTPSRNPRCTLTPVWKAAVCCATAPTRNQCAGEYVSCGQASQKFPDLRVVSNTYSFDRYSSIFLYVSETSRPGAIPVVLPKTPPIIGVRSSTRFLPALKL